MPPSQPVGGAMEKSDSKMNNRKLFPKCAEFVDGYRKYFEQLSVLYVKENGIEKGKKGDEGFPINY